MLRGTGDMDKFTFYSNIIDSLAWPITSLVIFVLFRKEIKKTISNVKKGKIGSAEFEFEKEVEVISETVSRKTQIPKLSIRDKEIASADPRSAIIKTWIEIEHLARRVFHKYGISYTGTSHTPFLPCIKELEKKDIITFDDYMLIKELQILRNRAIHEEGFHPSVESAKQYIALSKQVKAKLEASIE